MTEEQIKELAYSVYPVWLHKDGGGDINEPCRAIYMEGLSKVVAMMFSEDDMKNCFINGALSTYKKAKVTIDDREKYFKEYIQSLKNNHNENRN